MVRPLTPRQLAFDVSLAGLCLVLRLAPMNDSPLVWAVVLGMTAALALRRLSPTLALLIAWVGALLQIGAGLPPDLSNLAILAVLYSTSRYGNPTLRWWGLASAILGGIVSTVYVFWDELLLASATFVGIDLNIEPTGLWFVSDLLVALFSAIAVLTLSWTLGLLAKTWHVANESRRRQSAAEQVVVIEQERNRIARDMHDVVAHSLAVVIAQADGARYVRANDPDAVDEALTTISSVAREALSDVRLLLGQLRHTQGAGPQPVLADLDRLVAQLEASGLLIALHQEGTPPSLHHAQQLAVYRIVQEGLTNALRHGDTGQAVQVTIAWARDAADLTISNATEIPSAPIPVGHGIAGMRERAVLAGGSLTTTHEHHRFIVGAHIPVPVEVIA